MAITFHPLTQHIGAEVSGVDIRQPLTPSDANEIQEGMSRFAVLVFKRQPLTGDQQLAFSRSLGPLEESKGTSLRAPEDYRLPTVFADVSNLTKDDEPFALDDRRRLFAIGNRLWHSDSSFKVVPARYSILHSLSVVSKGGNTEFAHMGAAYDALDEETRNEATGLICEHSQMFSRMQIGFTDFSDEEAQRFKPVRQTLVREHPSTGRRSLYLSSHAGTIIGWPRQEAMTFLRDLAEHATQPQFVYKHEWDLGDLVMWDNQQTMHRVRRFPHEERRDMRRTTLAGSAPTTRQVN
ncbi:MAG: TauD/TfdA family dioxygenase [Chromatiales bacterium]|jgi:alpha-ketoglutarate-dependent 2,4-dichlorophenoxyacetate dioxygenase|nr:TauD/TfdA family dioxygenase [Chromatiales bacterium]